MLDIGGHGLKCPEPDDYAAVALYMQCLAQSIDSALQAQLESLESFFDRPTIIVTNSANVTITAPGSRNDIFDTVIFNNSGFMSLELNVPSPFGGNANIISIGSLAGAAVTVPYLRGVYSIGMGQRMQAVGAEDLNERQVCHVEVTDTSSTDFLFNFNTTFNRMSDVTRNLGLGIPDAQQGITSVILQGTSGVQVEHFASTFSNTSNVNVLAGAFLWVTYDGPTDAVEVA